MRASGFAVALLLLVAAPMGIPQRAEAGIVVRAEVEPGAIAALNDGTRLFLEARAPKGPSAQVFFKRYLADPEQWRQYRNRISVAIPYRMLKPAFVRRMLLALFPDDYVDDQGWWHVVQFDGALGQEDVESLALWLTGHARYASTLLEQPENARVGAVLAGGTVVFVPRSLLLEAMRAPTPERNRPVPIQPAVSRASDTVVERREGDLEFGRDQSGPFAGYRLKRGEALYTSVIVRFTDFRENEDIHGALRAVIARSGIRDATAMEPGDLVKIPVDMLSAQYHPEGSPVRQAYESVRTQALVLREARPRSRSLEGVAIVLDPGHGGRDHGAAHGGLYEDELTYDIVCRIKHILESETRATVFVTVLDPNQGYEPSDVQRFRHDTDEVLVTTPRYPNWDARVSANLRWYLANDFYREQIAQGIDKDNMLFASIHCDAIFNSSLRGAMVYIPGAQYRRDYEQPAGAIYAGYEEAQGHLGVRTTSTARRRDEALSRNFAQTLLRSLQTNDPPLKVHSASDPIRNVIRRSRRSTFVPAVLRNTLIPTKVLVETANLTNATDRERLADPKWRQWFAEAFVTAVRTHFEGRSGGTGRDSTIALAR